MCVVQDTVECLITNKYIRRRLIYDRPNARAMGCQSRRTLEEEGHQLEGGNALGYIKDLGIS